MIGFMNDAAIFHDQQPTRPIERNIIIKVVDRFAGINLYAENLVLCIRQRVNFFAALNVPGCKQSMGIAESIDLDIWH